MAPPAGSQHEDLCVNLKSRALKHGLIGRDEFLIVRGTWSSDGWKETLKGFEAGTQRVPQKPASAKELNRLGDDDKLLLIVGLVPSDPNFNHEAAKSTGKKGKGVGSGEIAPMEEIGDDWYRVAVPIPAMANDARQPMKSTTQTKVYCLFHAEPTGLCTGGLITSEEVFYFSEFRTMDKSVEARKKAWNGKIKAHINSVIGVENTTAEQQQITVKGSGVPMVIVRPEIDLANKLKLLTAAMLTNNTPELRTQITNIIEIEDLDLKVLDDWDLREFLDPESPLGPKDSKAILEAARNRWPDLAITQKSIKLLKTGIREQKLVFPYAHLRGFLVAGHEMLIEKFDSQESLDDNEVSLQVIKIKQTVGKILWLLHTEPRAAIEANKFPALVEAVIHHLQRISESCEHNETALINAAGMQGTTLSSNEAAGVYASAVDKDAGILAFGQGQRVLENDNARVLRSIRESIDALARILKELLKH